MGIVEIIITAIGYVVSAVLSIIAFVQKSKNKDKTQANVALQDDISRLEVLSQISVFCDEAEKLCGPGTGSLKRMYVTIKGQTLAHEKGINISQDEIDAEIKKVLNAPQSKTEVPRSDIQ